MPFPKKAEKLAREYMLRMNVAIPLRTSVFVAYVEAYQEGMKHYDCPEHGRQCMDARCDIRDNGKDYKPSDITREDGS